MKITPVSKKLETLLHGKNVRYVVPDYQRDYSWTPIELEELWLDILRSWQNDSEYFMGTIVLNTEPFKSDDKKGQYEIVDGQQRLATFTVLFSVIRAIASKYLKDHDSFQNIIRSEDNDAIANRIVALSEDRIMHKGYPDQFFLTLNKKNNKIFNEEIQQNKELLISDDELKIKPNESRVKKTKKYFTRQILDFVEKQSSPLRDLDSLLEHISVNLEFISIEVETGYDAYLLFESLNSKGMDLSIADLLKNKMLMECGDEEEKLIVLENWEKMVGVLEDKSSNSSVSEYLRIYWIATRNVSVTKNELYKVIKNALDNSTKVTSLSDELLNYANEYVAVRNKDYEWPSTNHSYDSKEHYLAEIAVLKYTICLPSLLYASAKKPEILKELARKSVNYLFRLVTIGDFSVGKASALFTKVLDKLHNKESDEEIFSTFENAEKVSNDEFKDLFKDFRTKDNNIAKYILSKLHIHSHGVELIPNYRHLHLEHVLPQDYTEWQEDGFDKGASNRWEDLIYHIGNMTLLDSALNQSASNKVFVEKVEYYKPKMGNEDIGSTIYMTNEIYNNYENEQREWSIDEITNRANEWANDVTSVWPIS